jgi:general secretion pathway protein C
MGIILRKYFWAINFLVISLCAFLAAKALGRYVEASLTLGARSRPASSRAVIPPIASGATERDISSILDRNIFCSTCEATMAASDDPDDPNRPEGANGEQPVKTSLQLKLIATLVSEEHDALHFASILDLSTNETHIYTIGSRVPGDAVISEIANRHVILQQGGRAEYLALDADTGAGSATGTAGPRLAAAPRLKLPTPLPGLENVAKGIKRITGSKYELSRQVVSQVFSNRSLLARGGRIVPVMKNGRPAGFRFFGRKGSIGSMIGLFGGDTIKAINGHSVATPEQALEVWSKLKNASYISLGVERKGTYFTNEYYVR